jgi:metal-responsive CopG/Arc/MetJ family transcriptional regulator
MPNKTKTAIGFGVSIPMEVLAKVDIQRGYTSRSKYILMALECLAETTAKRSVQPDLVGRLQADGSVSQSPEGAYEHYE